MEYILPDNQRQYVCLKKVFVLNAQMKFMFNY